MLLRRTPPGHGLTRVELGVVVVILGLTLCFLAVFLLRQRERALRAQCVNHLRRLGQAVHAYHLTADALPPARIADGYATWAVVLASQLDGTQALRNWEPSLPFATQAETARRAPAAVFFCPARRRPTLLGESGALGDYAAVAGNGDPRRPWTGPEANGPLIPAHVERRDGDRILAWRSRTTYDSLTRGLSVTLLLGEKHVALDRLGDPDHGDGSLYDGGQAAYSSRAAGPHHPLARSPTAPVRDVFGSAHADVVQFLNADGSVRTFLLSVDPAILGRLTTRD